MQLERNVAEGVHRIQDAYVNWYLVEDGEGVTIVDAGHPASWTSLHLALGLLGRHVADVHAIVLTHGHFDHVGFARRARKELGIPVHAPEGDAQIVAHPWRYPHEHSRIRQFATHPPFRKVFARMGAAGALAVRGVEQPLLFADDAILDVPGRPTVISTPGHTDGHVSLLLGDRGVLLAGDALVTFNPYTGGHGPQIVSGAATADSARALASLDAVAGLRVDTLATGHGPVWRGEPAQAVALARAAGPS